MPRRKPNFEFQIHVDPSCLSAPMDEEPISQQGDVEITEEVNASVPGNSQEDGSETTTEETNQVEDVAETSVMAEKQEPEDNAAEAVVEEENTDTPEVEQDVSLIEEEEEDRQEHEGEEDSVLSSIESEAGGDPEDDDTSQRSTSRRASGRTEALIHAAARDIVARIESHKEEQEQEHGDDSILSAHTDVSHDQEQLDSAEVSHIESSELDHEEESEATPTEVGDSSSQHEVTDEEVFSDKSARSSLGSYDGGSESGKAAEISDDFTVATRTPRISDISQYDKEEEFIPTARGTPRLPFRTTSDIRAMQMSSPTPSVIGSVIASPRSSKRPFPTVSRLGSPAASAQYSPKNRTPSRFKVKKEAPLVLLHATLLPLRWMWGDLVNSLDSSEMSEEAKTLRESWRALQDRMGDTVAERGILLGHPQNDYEILEERLLEALDLPMRRRARILECGHYLGPANENTLGDDSESEDDFDVVRPPMKRRWCNTCKSEIRYDSLGPGKIFRVKVYASNGLMRAGAWAACWKEMERVDVELEPLVEPSVQEELTRLAGAQREREAAQQQPLDIASEIIQQVEEQQNASYSAQPDLMHAHVEVSPIHLEPAPVRRSMGEERRYRDEERLREIYGVAPDLEPEHMPSSDASEEQPYPDSYIPPPSPRPHSEKSYARRENPRHPYQSASLPELLLQSVRVLMRDTKNLVIIALSVFVLLMALRTTPQQPQFDSTIYEVKSTPQMQHIPVAEVGVAINEQAPVAEPVESYAVTTQSAATQSIMTHEGVAPESVSTVIDPCATFAAAQQQQPLRAIEPSSSRAPSLEAVKQMTTVKVVETVTETETVQIETVTETETMKVKVTATMTETAHTSDTIGIEPLVEKGGNLAEISELEDGSEVHTVEEPAPVENVDLD
ncbi:hypothetical protein BJ170DRAFT_32923 [Xylariales sp. AK1849]|nr:hypothetical protein BJ170DRAFT_32923 [Xylariales sp. AK1849]